ncbi:MAG: glycine betaine/proline transport system permease protein [Nocardioidaceae bacterium]|nr:glycine betaine/proline transport system permease protein [Nocardioidaceae bacterium]
MSTLVTSASRPGAKEEQPRSVAPEKRRTGLKLGVVAVVWVVGWLLFRGHNTLATPFQQLNGLHTWINDLRDNIQASAQTNWFFHGVIGNISDFFNWLVAKLQSWVSLPAPPRPVPAIGWLGVVALLGWVGLAAAGIRWGLVVVVTVLLFGLGGFWQDGVDTLIITVISVLACMVVGLPLGIAMARRRWLSTAVTPVLDVMQTMPSFAYLSPLALIFGIGPSSAVVLTFIYALPPLVRITEHGIRSVPESTIEAAGTMGLTSTQLLRKVQLPMARRTIVVGINQCTMAALSMAVIAAFVAGPGLGQDVSNALSNLDVGTAAVAGLLIVAIAIMLDRTTTAASERRELTQGRVASVSGPGVLLMGVVLERLPRWASVDHRAARRLPSALMRRIVLSVALVPVVVCIYLSRQYLDLASFPDGWNIGTDIASKLNDFVNWFVDHVDTVTTGFKNLVTYSLLNPLQNLMANSPWWLMAVVLLGAGMVLGGWRALVSVAVCLAIILGTGLWNDAMITLTMTLVATILVMISALVLGIAMGRNRLMDLWIRPVLDTFQTIPSFVYLVPALALFGASRFTAIVAAVAYGVPIATKLVADGIRGVSETTVEAARASGITSWQMILKVQIPMARESLVLATNQGLLYVLSVVVIGGLVGGGSLGYLVVSGFSQDQLFGKGLAAGIAITALGVMLDRVARYTAARYGRA